MIEKIESITKEAVCVMDVNVITEGINSLIRAGYYESREKLLDDAFRTMLEVRPTLKTEMAEWVAWILRGSYVSPRYVPLAVRQVMRKQRVEGGGGDVSGVYWGEK